MGAQNATLTFMVGGTSQEYDRVKDFLTGMGRKITHCGTYGMGEAAKICNNMMLAISMCGVAETMNLAIRLGLDPKVFNEIINSSTGRCWASEVNNPVPGLNPGTPPSDNYKGGFSAALITKDLGLASSVGELNFHFQLTLIILNIFHSNRLKLTNYDGSFGTQHLPHPLYSRLRQ